MKGSTAPGGSAGARGAATTRGSWWTGILRATGSWSSRRRSRRPRSARRAGRGASVARCRCGVGGALLPARLPRRHPPRPALRADVGDHRADGLLDGALGAALRALVRRLGGSGLVDGHDRECTGARVDRGAARGGLPARREAYLDARRCASTASGRRPLREYRRRGLRPRCASAAAPGRGVPRALTRSRRARMLAPDAEPHGNGRGVKRCSLRSQVSR